VWPPRDGAFVYNAVHLFTTVVKPLFCRLKAEGIENMPLQGSCVLTCNHTMGPDFLVVGYASRRQVYFMAKQELFEIHPALTWLFNTAGAFSIRRGETDLVAVGHAIELVKSGHVLGMFPEGTRSRSGKLQRGRSGAARIAIQAQAPVVPAYVANAGPIFLRSNYWSTKPRAAVTVRFGPPLPPPANANDSRALRTFTREIMQAIGELAVGLEDATERVDEASGVETERTGLFD
jgi:1-acyl-sn-glycerol-3-phosphate acyltransferase